LSDVVVREAIAGACIGVATGDLQQAAPAVLEPVGAGLVPVAQPVRVDPRAELRWLHGVGDRVLDALEVRPKDAEDPRRVVVIQHLLRVLEEGALYHALPEEGGHPFRRDDVEALACDRERLGEEIRLRRRDAGGDEVGGGDVHG
jgi:hypothetical protein